MMRLILIAPQAAIPYFVSILKPDVEIARIVLIDMRLGRGAIDLNGRKLEVCSYDYLRETVTELCFDFILTTGYLDNVTQKDLEEAGVPSKKFFPLNKVFFERNWLHAFFNFFRFVEPRISQYKTIVSGISLARSGTDIDCYQLPTLRLASSGQDLYFNYKIAERLMSMNGAAFKYAILELAPYIFHYDQSLSMNSRGVMLMYYFGLHDVHHCPMTCEAIEAIFNENFLRADRLPIPTEFDLRTFPPDVWAQFTPLARMNVRKDAEKWSTKRYPETLAENERIFDDYLSLLERHGVQPIVAIFPSIDAYREFFPKQLLDELHYILRRNGLGKRFLFLDMWNSDQMFGYDDFGDATHLNQVGNKKMSRFLNDYIMNLEAQRKNF